jgi:hypothetical protein
MLPVPFYCSSILFLLIMYLLERIGHPCPKMILILILIIFHPQIYSPPTTTTTTTTTTTMKMILI